MVGDGGTGGGAVGGTAAHDASSARRPARERCLIIPGNKLMQVYMFESGLWIFILESVLALTVLALIVWWTLPRKKRPPQTGEDG